IRGEVERRLVDERAKPVGTNAVAPPPAAQESLLNDVLRFACVPQPPVDDVIEGLLEHSVMLDPALDVDAGEITIASHSEHARDGTCRTATSDQRSTTATDRPGCRRPSAPRKTFGALRRARRGCRTNARQARDTRRV